MNEETKHSSTRLSFVRVLGHDYSKQLQIPQEFTAHFNDLPHRFIVESAVIKKCWRVEMEQDVDGHMYFRVGWHDFVESHPLEVGNFLVFEYTERSIFHVKVYGRNGCETTSSHHKLGKTTEFEEVEQNESFKSDEMVSGKHHPRKRIRELFPQKNKRGIYKKQRAAIKKYSRPAKTSISKSRVFFSITLHKRKRHQFIQLTIPKAISLQKLQNKDKVILQDAKGSCWPVKVASRRDGRRIFSQGWRDFMKENEFSPGDTLNFEFISDNLIQVWATQTAEVDHCSEEAKYQNEASYMDYKHDICKKQDEVVKKKMKNMKVSISKDRVCFSSSLQKNHQFVQLTIPKVVTLQRLYNKEEVTLQDEKGNCWSVKVAHKTSGQAIFSQGWKKFMKENGFAAGDILHFEFISDNLIQVHTTKASIADHHSEETKYEDEDMDCKVGEENKPVTTTKDDKAIEDSIATKKASSELRSSMFFTTWRQNTTGAYLDIPKTVAEDQNLKNKDTVEFRDVEGKCWPLQVRTWWDGRVVLTKGWVEFWKDHAITEGDSLDFEFVSAGQIQVTINRGNPTVLDPSIGATDDDNQEAMHNEEASQLKVQMT